MYKIEFSNLSKIPLWKCERTDKTETNSRPQGQKQSSGKAVSAECDAYNYNLYMDMMKTAFFLLTAPSCLVGNGQAFYMPIGWHLQQVPWCLCSLLQCNQFSSPVLTHVQSDTCQECISIGESPCPKPGDFRLVPCTEKRASVGFLSSPPCTSIPPSPAVNQFVHSPSSRIRDWGQWGDK